MNTLETTTFTRETGIWISRVSNGKKASWRHVDCNDARHAEVGPAYSSRRALAEDHYDYLRRGGWLRRDPGCEYVIHRECDAWGTSVFWSNANGWGDLEDATRYESHVSNASTALAMKAGDARWISLHDANSLSNTQA
jgi:hypothetical protein